MANTPKVLSIIEEYLGHKTYGHLMRTHFAQASACNIDFCWYNDDREIHTRILNRLLSYVPKNSWLRDQNLTVHLLRIQLGFAYMARRLALRKLKQSSYSVLHFHTQPLAYLSLDLMEQWPTVISIDRTIIQLAREKTDPQLHWTYRPHYEIEKRVFQKAAAIVAFSDNARQSVLQDYRIDSRKVKVIYPGVDLAQFPLPETSSPFNPKRYNILFIGSDFDRKGGQDLLVVFLKEFAHEAELHLVTTADIQCDHPNVHIHRQIAAYTPEWLQLYHQADVFVMPTYSEPFGWVFIEAMAAGLPIIATAISAIPEMVRHEETGLLLQPGDRPALAQSLRTLMNNPQLRSNMGLRARQLATQKFNAHKNFQTLESLFWEIANRNSIDPSPSPKRRGEFEQSPSLVGRGIRE